MTGERASIVADSGDAARSQAASRIRGVDHVAVLVPDIESALTEFSGLFGFALVADEVLADPAVRLVHLDAGNVDIQLVQPLGPGRVADDLSARGAGLHHLCFGVPALADALADLHEPDGGIFLGGQGRRACFLTRRPSQLYIELIEFAGGAAYGTFATAASRLLGYWPMSAATWVRRFRPLRRFYKLKSSPRMAALPGTRPLPGCTSEALTPIRVLPSRWPRGLSAGVLMLSSSPPY